MNAYVIRRARPGAFAAVAVAAAGVALLGATGVANLPAIVFLNLFIVAALVQIGRASVVVRLDGHGVRLQHHEIVPWPEVAGATLTEGMLVVRPRGRDDAPAVPLAGVPYERAALEAAFAAGGVVLREDTVSR